MFRRTFLERGGELAAGSLLQPAEGFREAKERGRDTSQETGDATTIKPRRDPEARRIFPVSDEKRIQHRFAMRTVADEGPAELREMRDTPEYRFQIDGEDIDDQGAYWSNIYELDDQQWGIAWEYTLPPQPAGKKQFTVQIDFLQPVENIQSGDGRTTWEGHYEFGCIYDVRPPVEDIGCPLEIPESGVNTND